MVNIIGQRLGQYEILAQIGKGGMATVYRAHQSSFNRDVAIKIIKNDLGNQEEFVARFRREAQLIATLAHPHILKVFDYGREDEIVYLVMELMTGGSLANFICRGPLPFNVIARLLDQITEALDYAHEQGVVHRDMKPQNVLLDTRGNAFITDFGIAKMVGERTMLTQSGAVMGTPAYMAPEQWFARRVDGRTDLYALGIMLYEMLTGSVPFESETPAQIMYMHLQAPPPSPRLAQPNIPVAVEEVIKVALAKDPQQRFASGKELASAFRGALSGISPSDLSGRVTSQMQAYWQARPTDPALVPEVKTATAPQAGSRNLPVGILAGISVVIIAVLMVVVIALISQRSANNAAAAVTNIFTATATETSEPSSPVAVVLAASPTLEPATATPSPTPTLDIQQRAFLTVTVRAQDTRDAQTVDAIIRSTFSAQDRTGTAVIEAQFTKTFTPTATITPSPSDTPTATATITPSATLTSTYTATFTPSSTATPSLTLPPSATNTTLPTQPYQVTAVSMVSTIKPLLQIGVSNAAGVRFISILKGHQGTVNEVDFSDTLLASGGDDTTIRLWDPLTYTVKLTLVGHSASIKGLVFSPNGQLIASAGDDQTLRLWDAQTGKDTVILQGHNGPVLDAAFSPDGKILASAGSDRTVILWDVASGSQKLRLSSHTDKVNAIAFSPDGTRLASVSSDRSVRLWDTQSGKLIATLNGHEDEVFGVVFSPDGKLVASASADRTIRLWDSTTQRQVLLFEGHTDDIYSVAFSPDGALLASASKDKLVKLWDIKGRQLVKTLRGHTGAVRSVRFNRAGTLLASSGSDQDVRLWVVSAVPATDVPPPPTNVPTQVNQPTNPPPNRPQDTAVPVQPTKVVITPEIMPPVGPSATNTPGFSTLPSATPIVATVRPIKPTPTLPPASTD